jgi:hypothetical protein
MPNVEKLIILEKNRKINLINFSFCEKCCSPLFFEDVFFSRGKLCSSKKKIYFCPVCGNLLTGKNLRNLEKSLSLSRILAKKAGQGELLYFYQPEEGTIRRLIKTFWEIHFDRFSRKSKRLQCNIPEKIYLWAAADVLAPFE